MKKAANSYWIFFGIAFLLSIFSVYLIAKWIFEVSTGVQIAKELLVADFVIFVIIYGLPAIISIPALKFESAYYRGAAIVCLIVSGTSVLGLIYLFVAGKAYVSFGG
jgi:hypothetical protein